MDETVQYHKNPPRFVPVTLPNRTIQIEEFKKKKIKK